MTDTLRLDGKVALIVGGAGAIGREAAAQMAALGARIAITHTPGETKAAAAAAIIAGLPGTGHAALPADVADTATIIALSEAIESKYGRLDILINAAGFTNAIAHSNLDALSDDLIDRIFAVNWRGQFAVVRAFAPLLKASGDGLIINLSSIAGFTGVGSSIAYCAAKAGIDVMTKSLARALAPEIRVLAVSPGVVDTGFVPDRGADFNAKAAASLPLKRIASAHDVALAIVACSTHLPYSTGHIIQVDGGRAL
jgi:3-oxoacyl-[acyl-carrier protein] reductase